MFTEYNSKPEQQIGEVIKLTLEEISHQEFVSMMEQHMLNLHLLNKVHMIYTGSNYLKNADFFFKHYVIISGIRSVSK